MSVSRTIRFPDDVERAIREEAERQDRSFSYLVAKVCGERFLMRENPYSISRRPEARAEREALEESLSEGLSTGEDVADARPTSAPRASEPSEKELQGLRNVAEQGSPVLDAVEAKSRASQVPGVVRASSLVKQGVRPIPKRGER